MQFDVILIKAYTGLLSGLPCPIITQKFNYELTASKKQLNFKITHIKSAYHNCTYSITKNKKALNPLGIRALRWWCLQESNQGHKDFQYPV
jgi:hypothetical protein